MERLDAHQAVQLANTTDPETTALFLCWPTYDSDWAHEALAEYRGKHVMYVGEWEYGCCATQPFFQLLESQFDELEIGDDLYRWWGIHDSAWLHTRRTPCTPCLPCPPLPTCP